MLKMTRTEEQRGKFSFDGENHFSRIEDLLKDYWQQVPSVDVERARIYTKVFQETEGEEMIIRRGKGFQRYCEEREVRLPEGQLILGDTAIRPRAGAVCPEFHCGWLSQELDTIATRKQDPYSTTPEVIRELKEEIFPYWKGKTVSEHWMQQIPPWVKELAVKTGIIDTEIKTQSAPGETAPYWEMLIEKGLGALKAEARGYIDQLDEALPEDYAKIGFYRASIMTLEGLSTYSRRLGDLAKEAAKSADPQRQKELLQMADNCHYIAEHKPETFWQAMQFIYLLLVGCLMEGNGPSFSPGRMDQYMDSYYDKDIKEGRLTMETALELIECFYIKCAETTWFLSENAVMYFAGYQPFHSLIVGGINESGVDVTNELSYLFLTAKMDVQLHGPSMCARVHKQSPQDFLLHIAKLAKLGTGFPAVYNDESAIKMMLLSGGTMEEARNYQMVGCVEPFISGKMAKWSDGGHYNFASAIEFVLTNGHSIMNDNRKLGIETGDPLKMNFQDIKDGVKEQLGHMIRAITICANVNERLYNELTPFPFVSSLLDGSYKTGKDLTAGGVKYTIGPALIGTGIADLVDSLSAIKTHVFDEKNITMEELITAIKSDFEGHEDMRLMLANNTPMYGNDIEEVDLLAGEMTDFAYKEISSYKSWRGPEYISGLYPVSSHVPHGLVVGALPYGRKAGTALADGCSPKGGTDHEGPTAVLKSVSKVNHEVHTSGTLLNMRLDPISVEGDAGLARIAQIIRTFVDLNIYHIQFNVVNTDVLRKAQKDPEKYKSLIVRVAGYSAYFTELCEEMQEDIIQRTIHSA